MERLRILSASEQVAEHLRRELMGGRWSHFMPGADLLARELGAGRNTIDAALLQLVKEGILESGGAGRKRRVLAHGSSVAESLDIRILSYSVREFTEAVIQDAIKLIGAAGHTVKFADKTLMEMKMDVRRVAAHVSNQPADAWVVYAGSREILEWFSESAVPAFALAGRMKGIAIAGVKPDKIHAQKIAVQRLIELGHRRIVKIVRPERVNPYPATVEQAFLDELERHGIKTGAYNLAVWEGGISEFHQCIESLFQFTPPTALFLDEPMLFLATQQHLARKGLLAPEHVSLIGNDPDPYYEMFDPPISHITWKREDIARAMARWVDRVGRGKDDRRQTLTKSFFVEGGTIGPALVRSGRGR
jgi:DNA-binding LacI/PurR family transcriptional regulator/DNA-binding transcriptional regulator YhcF (GntR family)